MHSVDTLHVSGIFVHNILHGHFKVTMKDTDIHLTNFPVLSLYSSGSLLVQPTAPSGGSLLLILVAFCSFRGTSAHSSGITAHASGVLLE